MGMRQEPHSGRPPFTRVARILGTLGRWFQTPEADEPPALPVVATTHPVPVGGSLEEL